MEQVETGLRELRESVGQGVRDHSLVSFLKERVEDVRLDGMLVKKYCDYLFKLYDLSNSSFFITRPPHAKRCQTFELDPLAISIKALVLRMFSKLIAFFNDNPAVEIPLSLLRQSLEIMVMVSRVLLDLQKSSEVRPVYPRVVSCREAVGDVLSLESELCHWLNIVELLTLDVDCCKIDVTHYKHSLEEILCICEKISSSAKEYIELARNMTLQTVLKLLKKGNSQEAKILVPYLSQKMKGVVSDLMSLSPQVLHQENTTIKFSPFYELYLQLKQNGIENVAEQNLRIFLSKEEHFNDPRIFDVVALTGQILPLEIWFEINLNMRGRGQQIQMAYKCFMYVVDMEIDKVEGKGNAFGIEEQHHEKSQVLSKLMRLARVVMVNMLSEKKDSVEPIVNLVKRLSKLLIHLVMSLNTNIELVQQFVQKLLMICGKYGLNQVGRSINCIGFYYQLVMGVVTEQSYGKMCKTNLLDKGSQLFRSLKMAYLFRTGKEIGLNEERQLLTKQPFIMLLFARQPQEELILRIQPETFAKMNQKWQIYLLLLHQNNQDQHLSKLLKHMEQTLICTEWQSINMLEMNNIETITSILLNYINNDEKYSFNCNLKMQLSLVVLYLTNLSITFGRLSEIHGAVLFNRYSKLVKLLSLAQEKNIQDKKEERQVSLYCAKRNLCHQHELLKMQYLTGEIANQAGLLVLVDMLHRMLQKSGLTQQEAQFFKFIRFEILCVCDEINESELTTQKNQKLLKLFCSSKFIKKQLKLKLMRKLIREDLISDSRLISLQQMGELIVLADDPMEKKVFASYILRSFGEEGKTYLMLRNQSDPEAFGFLSELDDDEV